MVGVSAGEVVAGAPAGVAEFGGEFDAVVLVAGTGGDDGADADVRGAAEEVAAAVLAGFGFLPGAAERPAGSQEWPPAARGAEVVFADDGELPGVTAGSDG